MCKDTSDNIFTDRGIQTTRYFTHYPSCCNCSYLTGLAFSHTPCSPADPEAEVPDCTDDVVLESDEGEICFRCEDMSSSYPVFARSAREPLVPFELRLRGLWIDLRDVLQVRGPVLSFDVEGSDGRGSRWLEVAGKVKKRQDAERESRARWGRVGGDVRFVESWVFERILREL